MTNLTLQQISDIKDEAIEAAHAAAKKFFTEELGGVDQLCCGFAWVNIYEHDGEKIKGNTKVGRMFKKVGITQDYTKAFQIWNPSRIGCQNVDTLLVGARAAAKVFQSYGFKAYAGSRLD